jgi:polar amino acid transport system substrate-binding protein
MAQAENDLGQDRAIRFAVIYTEEPPYVYSTEVSKHVGIVPELVEAVGRELAFKVEFFPTSRKGLEAAIMTGQADFSWLAKEWVQNSEDFVFSDPILNHREFLYSLKPFSSSDQPADWVRGKTICVHQNYKYPTLTPFFNQKIAKPIMVSSEVSITNLFLRQKCDLLYSSELRANWKFQELSLEIEIYRSSQPLKQTDQTFMFSKNWQSQMPKFNQAISKIKNSGELKKIVDGQIQLNLNGSE